MLLDLATYLWNANRYDQLAVSSAVSISPMTAKWGGDSNLKHSIALFIIYRMFVNLWLCMYTQTQQRIFIFVWCFDCLTVWLYIYSKFIMYWYIHMRLLRVCTQSSFTKDIYAFLCLVGPTKEVTIMMLSLLWCNLDWGCASRGDGESLARAQWTCARWSITGFWVGRSRLAIATWWQYPDSSRFQALSRPWIIGWPFFPKLCAAIFFDMSSLCCNYILAIEKGYALAAMCGQREREKKRKKKEWVYLVYLLKPWCW